MPVRPENQARYPSNWGAISAEIRNRARNCCEWPGCAARQYSIGVWMPNGIAHVWNELDIGYSYKAAWRRAAEIQWDRPDEKVLVIVLTVAHLNHQPEDCRPENLAAWCQRHHLAYDAQHHAVTRARSRRSDPLTPELF